MTSHGVPRNGLTRKNAPKAYELYKAVTFGLRYGRNGEPPTFEIWSLESRMTEKKAIEILTELSRLGGEYAEGIN